jgi:hypothetical protein
VKRQEVLKALVEADVGVINLKSIRFLVLGVAFKLLLSSPVFAGVLPEDRADILYHSYEGDGVDINGPSILVRKSLKDKVSIGINHFVDQVSGASIDVRATGASAYTEKRTENSLSLDYLNGKTVTNFNYTSSEENDFDARSAHLDISQEFFGDLTTLNLGYSQGWDTVRRRGDDVFESDNSRRNFRLGVSQILTKNSLMALNWETITDEGRVLNNPYRRARIISSDASGFTFLGATNTSDNPDGLGEFYPSTRTSDTLALRAAYYLPYRAALKFEYKFFSDTWGVAADTVQLEYTHPLHEHWIFDLTLRYYSQTKADFYSDLLPSTREISRDIPSNFYARDKELSTFGSNMIGFGVSYERKFEGSESFKRYSLNLKFNYIEFDYEDFRNAEVHRTNPGEYTAGNEPMFSFDAKILRLYFSLYY